MGDRSPTRRSSTNKNSGHKGVQFHGVEVREYFRALSDNPSAEGGVPLGLDWEYNDITREILSAEGGVPLGLDWKDNETDITCESLFVHTESTISTTYSPVVVIPIDEYEKQAEMRRRAKLMEMCKFRQKSMKYILGKNAPKRRSKTLPLGEENDNSNSSEHTLSEEQMRQLSAHWLKIQPLTAREREKIILHHTNCTRAEIEDNERVLRKARRQRQHSMASAESGIDEWHIIIEFIKRRFRRFRSGISKEKEQELLWEAAQEYLSSIASNPPLGPRTSLRSSISSVSNY